ncbi:unnamed protein product [Miscanthus lutarioriparius]|uniref:Uncharacterized protein n=1 Tax=Miscanthus lutarioriparius TaxID=422564 RepID=A0A811Q9J0_9POAL|nr:unnamed protein product [Miscanthus lutarioriparius]
MAWKESKPAKRAVIRPTPPLLPPTTSTWKPTQIAMFAFPSCGDMRSPSPPKGRRFKVSHRHAEPNPDMPYRFDFSLDPDPDPDAIRFEHSRGLPGHAVFVGTLPAPAAWEELPAHHLLARFSCSPVSGYTATQYLDLTVVVKIIMGSSGEVSHLREMLSLPETGAKVREILNKYMARKLQAMEKLLETQTELRGQVVLVKINNARRHISAEVLAIRDQINTRFGFPGYELVMLIDDLDPPMHAHLASADVFIAKTLATKKFMYYTVCRPEGPVAHLSASAPRKGSIIAKTGICFRPTAPARLTAVIRVNPWGMMVA